MTISRLGSRFLCLKTPQNVFWSFFKIMLQPSPEIFLAYCIFVQKFFSKWPNSGPYWSNFRINRTKWTFGTHFGRRATGSGPRRRHFWPLNIDHHDILITPVWSPHLDGNRWPAGGWSCRSAGLSELPHSRDGCGCGAEPYGRPKMLISDQSVYKETF